jgi:hypothetical protein
MCVEWGVRADGRMALGTHMRSVRGRQGEDKERVLMLVQTLSSLILDDRK